MKKYSKAPIEEAVFDIRIDPALAMEGKELESLYTKVSDFYPIKEAQKTFELIGEIKEGELAKSQAKDIGVIGFRFWDADRKQVCRIGLDGFGFSRLKPYSDWEICFPEAMRLWNIYKKEFNPRFIKRVAVRFINIINIPEVRFELEDYFNNPPQPPSGLPQNVAEFLSRLKVKYEENFFAIVTLALQMPTVPNVASILLDIDVFTEIPFNADDEDQLKNVFERLHYIKNDIFEKSITSKTKELIG
ncbi:MAG: TIGR04255 family protein [Deltaproteobacteria bacterium]|nr:TIGR04255 family protein [Deltaproteobacteria bacterium]